MRALGLTCGIGSMLIGARQAGFDVIGNIEWRTYYHKEDAEGKNTFKANFPGAFMKKKDSELTHDDIERIMGVELALGHPECLPGPTKVFTSRGWRRIKDVEVGDLVLTHKGRFKKVAHTYGHINDGLMITIRTKIGPGEDGTLFLTSNHPIMKDDGKWVEAGSISEGDRIKVLATQCKGCEVNLPIWREGGFCSISCAVRYQWKNSTEEEKALLTEKANEVTRERCANGVHQFQDPQVRSNLMKSLSSKRKGRTWIERKMEWALKEVGLSPTPQHQIGKHFVDFALVDQKIAVECDGEFFHRDKEREERRDRMIEKAGWSILHFQGAAIKSSVMECAEEVRRVSLNHSGKYRFMDVDVREVSSRRYDQRKLVYNLAVVDDHSYVAKGFVVHNCGSYSTMNGTNAWRGDKAPKVTDPGDIPLFTRLVAKIKPRFFVMDDLPKSFMAYSMKDYHDALPEYDLFPEWISNYNYGNIQKHRRRMFMVGALRGEHFAFIPGEFEHNRTVADEIGDLPIELEPGYRGNVANHDPHALDEPCGRGLHMDHLWHRPSWRDMKAWFEKAKIGETFRYHSPAGIVKNKPGWYKAKWDGPAPVLDGGSGHMHPFRNLPFTIRERARIQGFPDDFIFYGLRKNPDGTWCHERNIDLIKQTGKAMPIQFCRYASKLVRATILKEPLPEATNTRVIPANELVSGAKQWYCQEVGYSDQERACAACWLYSSCTIRSRKYGIGGQIENPVVTSSQTQAQAPVAPGPVAPVTDTASDELSDWFGAQEEEEHGLTTGQVNETSVKHSLRPEGEPTASPAPNEPADRVVARRRPRQRANGPDVKPSVARAVKPSVSFNTNFKKGVSNL